MQYHSVLGLVFAGTGSSTLGPNYYGYLADIDVANTQTIFFSFVTQNLAVSSFAIADLSTSQFGIL